MTSNRVTYVEKKQVRPDRGARSLSGLGFAAAFVALVACGGGSSIPSTPSGGVVLGTQVAYIGTTDACVPVSAVHNCVFSTVEIVATDASGKTLADKTFQLPIVLGQDNSTAVALP